MFEQKLSFSENIFENVNAYVLADLVDLIINLMDLSIQLSYVKEILLRSTRGGDTKVLVIQLGC